MNRTDQARWLRLEGIKLPLAELRDRRQETAALSAAAAKLMAVAPAAVHTLRLIRRSLDARDQQRPVFVYSVDVEVSGPARGKPAPRRQPLTLPFCGDGSPPPCIVGAGPAGLFAALLLARAGMRPLLIEQGREVTARAADVARFWREGVLDPASNIQNGEGGAGAFSDGKLTSRGKDVLGDEVLSELIAAGADPDIGWQQHPHIGSDRLPAIIARLRGEILALGGEIRFATRLQDIVLSRGRLCGLRLAGADGAEWEQAADTVILAVGNSARPLYRMLARRGVALRAKAFAVGLRIDHDQGMLDRAQYGDFAGHPLLGAAEYHLTYRAQGRGCYTFCNCPGGSIVNASSEPGCLAVNGVSLAARGSGRGNSAVVAQVFPGRDFGPEPLDGMEYQYRLERAAFALGGGYFALPVMAVPAFLGAGEAEIEPGFCPQASGFRAADLRGLLGEEITLALQQAIGHWQRQIAGFAMSGVLAAVESRTSAPLTILRGADRQSLNCRGLYPAGEGAGYAGGIVSSAVDGMRAALAVMEQRGAAG